MGLKISIAAVFQLKNGVENHEEAVKLPDTIGIRKRSSMVGTTKGRRHEAFVNGRYDEAFVNGIYDWKCTEKIHIH